MHITGVTSSLTIGTIREIADFFAAHPVVFGVVVGSTLVLALAAMWIFRSHRLEFQREHSPTGEQKTLITVEPLPTREYSQIEGLIEVQVSSEQEEDESTGEASASEQSFRTHNRPRAS